MLKKLDKRLLLICSAVFLAVFLVAGVAGQMGGGQCLQEEYFTINCGVICNLYGSTWGCYDFNEDRCCWEHVDGGACGEGSRDQCPECDPGGCGGF